MVFSSLGFLFFFLPIVLIGYVFLIPKLRNLWLFIASLVFYYMGAKEYVTLLLGVIVLAYISGLVLNKIKNKKLNKTVMFLSIFIMIIIMMYYKYWDFLIVNINLIFHKNLSEKNASLPVGISFFIFQAISYVVDSRNKCLKNPIDMGLYISFFPQLIAGPIVRFYDIQEYLKSDYRRINIELFSEGIWRFSIGICKKVLLANNLGGLADIVFGVRNISEFSVMYTWLGIIAYTLQIYFDFAGYSDMAIGLGKIFGFEFQENFNNPYIASTVKEFWRRWHISLSHFFRDYVYKPLGGNRCSKCRWIINIMLVWFLTGIWHGASWTYIIWGVAYGVIIIIETLVYNGREKTIVDKIIGHIYTLLIVMILWIVFRVKYISTAILYIRNMFGIGAKSFIDRGFLFQFKNYALIIFAGVLLSTSIMDWVKERYGDKLCYKMVSTTGLIVGILLSISYIYMGSYNPFLYFSF